MIDDTGLLEFNGSSRARRQVFTLAAVSLAAACVACVETVPADDAVVAELSSGQVLALCDELRDAMQRRDEPIQCDSADRYWVLPSNESCRKADLSGCNVSVGQLRQCHELARQDPCLPAFSPISPDDLSTVAPDEASTACPAPDTCYPFVPATGYTYVPVCSSAGLASLQGYDGVYEVTGLTGSWEDPSCTPLPELLESTSHFVLVSTESSGAPEVILQNCEGVAACQALAREIRATGNARGAEPVGGYNHLVACNVPEGTVALSIQSVVPDVPSCQVMSVPSVSVQGDPSSLSVWFSGLTDTEVSPGCGYIIAPGSADFCAARKEFGAARAASL